MDNFVFYDAAFIRSLVKARHGEIRLGERVIACPDGTPKELSVILKNSTAPYVLLGIPEDIGIRANSGVAGASTTWFAVLQSWLNFQSNGHLHGDEVLLLGHFEFQEPGDQSLETLRQLTSVIDQQVSEVVQQIFKAGKTPVVIGGGHNNAFPILHAWKTAHPHPLNVVNIDAHADLRSAEEGRHSGNGFSTALEKGFLNEYLIFGLQKYFINTYIEQLISSDYRIRAVYFDDLLLSEAMPSESFKKATASLNGSWGLELDVDSIAGFLSSAVSPSGFKLEEVRKMLLQSTRRWCYFHVCEGAVQLSDGREDPLTAKGIALILSDFMVSQKHLKH